MSSSSFAAASSLRCDGFLCPTGFVLLVMIPLSFPPRHARQPATVGDRGLLRSSPERASALWNIETKLLEIVASLLISPGPKMLFRCLLIAGTPTPQTASTAPSGRPTPFHPRRGPVPSPRHPTARPFRHDKQGTQGGLLLGARHTPRGCQVAWPLVVGEVLDGPIHLTSELLRQGGLRQRSEVGRERGAPVHAYLPGPRFVGEEDHIVVA